MIWVLPAAVALVGALLVVVRASAVVAEARSLQRALSSVAELRAPLLEVAEEARALASRAQELEVPRRPALGPAP